MPHAPLLTDLQLAIMRVLWDRGRGSVSEITEALRPSRELAQTTVATILSRLEKREVVGHETQSRQYLYHPILSESEVRRSMVSSLTDRLFGGDVTALLTHLLSAREISRGDLAKVKAILAQREARPGGHRDRR